MISCLAVIALPVCVPVCAQEPRDQNWSSFLGPRGDNSIEEGGLAREWPPDGPPVLWSVETGPGFGGASIHGDDVFLLDRIRNEADVLRCFALDDGRELWSFTYEAPGRLSYPGSRSVPTVTDEHVYTVGAFGHVHCVDRASGDPIWAVHQEELFDAGHPYFGWCQSPVLFGDLMVVAPLTEDVGLAAFDRATGDLCWTTPGVGQSHSTPILVHVNGRAQLLIVSARVSNEQRGTDQTPAQSAEAARSGSGGLISSFDPSDGRLLWSSFAPACTSPVAPPTVVGDDRILVSGGYRAGTVLLEITERSDGFVVREVFRNPRGAQVHPGVRWEDHLYLIANENANEARPRQAAGGLMCIDLEGNEQWRTGANPYFGRGPMLIADGVLIVQDGHSGVLRLIEATADAYRPLAEADLFPLDGRDAPRGRGGRQMWAPMAFSRGRLLLRSQEELKCVDVCAITK